MEMWFATMDSFENDRIWTLSDIVEHNRNSSRAELICLPGRTLLGELNISRNLTNLNIGRMKTLCPEMKRSRSALFEINTEKNVRGQENLQNSLFHAFRKTPNLRK